MNKKNNLLRRFLTFQKERLQLEVLVFTTTAVVLSSAAVSLTSGQSIFTNIIELIIALGTLLTFMYHIRVLDEYKDYDFDTKYHSSRPVQRGLITLKELLFIDILFLILFFLSNLFVSPYATIFLLFSFGYTLIAGNEFFMKKWIRKRFFLYNLLNLLQLLLLQFYLYALFNPSFSFYDPLLSIHFIFVLSNVGTLEVARKLKGIEEESKANDTYSSRLGVRFASLLYLVLCCIVYIFFFYMLIVIGFNSISFVISLFLLNLVFFTSVLYIIKKNKSSSQVLQGIAALFYLAMHLLLVLSKI